jgi:hypothetical protein
LKPNRVFDGALVASTGSHRQKHASQHFVATHCPQKFSKTPNRKARQMKLQPSYSNAGTIETQPPEPALNVQVACRVTPSKWPPDSFMDDADSGLNSDNDLKQPVKDPDTKRPGRKKSIKVDEGHVLTHAAKVDQPVEKHEEGDEEASSDGFEAIANNSSSDNLEANAKDPDYVDEDDMDSSEDVQGIAEDANATGAVNGDDDHMGQQSSHPTVWNQNQPDNLINPCLPKPKMNYESILIYNFGTLEDMPKRQAYLLCKRLFFRSSLNLNPTMGIRPLQIPLTELVDGFLGENIGSLYINGLKKRSHYVVPLSDYSHYKNDAKHCGIKLCIHKGQSLPTIIREDPHQFVLHNGIDHKDIIEGLGSEKLADNLLFPSPGTIPVLNKC